MNQALFSENTPWSFWRCQPDPPETVWQAAIQAAFPVLELSPPPDDLASALEQTLGEGRFGPDHWTLNTKLRLYYLLKPLLPGKVIAYLKRFNTADAQQHFPLKWPVEDRYARFLWEVMRQVLLQTGQKQITYRRFWPGGAQIAFVLTHDVENQAGQRFAGQVADLEERLGFRSSFNFVPERYPLDMGLVKSLRARGFEIGVHGLKHDGKLFFSKKTFNRRAARINTYLRSFQAAGFRTPMTHRNPEWLQALALEYDLSFFDTDPYEPMPGGSMSIWPYRIGRFVELPYTLVQDSTLAYNLGETTPKIWLDKLAFLRSYQGMALLNAHPDYLLDPALFSLYDTFLRVVKQEGDYWNPQPREAARWWRLRTWDQPSEDLPTPVNGSIVLENDCVIQK